MKAKRIGIIDSGIGGLTILNELFKKNFINAKYFYISDQNHVPYGGKTQEFMLERVRMMVELVLKVSVDLIVLACNTLTVETIADLRESYEIDFVGVEPYVNYINQNTGFTDDKVAMILTEATFKSQRFKTLLASLDTQNKIDVYPLKKLALLIEKLSSEELSAVKEGILAELSILVDKDYTKLILGCTHYHIVQDLIEAHLGLEVVDPHLPVVAQIAKLAQLEVSTNEKNVDNKFNYDPCLSGKWRPVDLRRDLTFLFSLK